MSVPLVGGKVRQERRLERPATVLALSGRHMFWLTGDADVFRLDLETGAEHLLARQQDDETRVQPEDLVVTDSEVYWLVGHSREVGSGYDNSLSMEWKVLRRIPR